MAGRTISHYQILHKLGEGGMGVVYKARDLNLPRFAAIKFIAPRLLDSPNAYERFLQEANTIAALNHPRIATIYEFNHKEEGPFLALEYLPGGTLQDKVAGRKRTGEPLVIEHAVQNAIQITEGLAHAHRNGVIHRDLKTANVLFTVEGTLKITDFGLSKFYKDSNVTAPTAVLGTPAYMAPEVVQGEQADPRSDLFSLGVVLYELLSGDLPFEAASSAAVIEKVLHATPISLRAKRRDLPAGVDEITSRLLEKDPAIRYQSANEVLRDLRAAVHDSGRTVSRDLAETATLTRQRSPETLVQGYRLWPALALIVIACAAVFAVIAIRGSLAEYFQARAIPAERRLVVVPFSPMGVDRALCDGLQEIISSKLTQLEQFQPALLVVPAADVRREHIESVREARASFGVNLALTGSVQRIQAGYRLAVNLVDTTTLTQLRTGTWDLKEEALSALQDRVVLHIADMLALALQPAAGKALGTGNTPVPGAYSFYVLGKGYLQRYERPENLAQAMAMFNQAIQQDQTYALAYAGRAEANYRKYEITKDRQSIEQARLDCLRAIELNGQLAPVRVTMGLIHGGMGRLGEATTEFRKALKLDPASGEAYRELAKSQEVAGKLDDAAATFRRAIELRPQDWSMYNEFGKFYWRHGRYAEAEQMFRRVIELTPDNSRGYSNLGTMKHLQGDAAGAASLLERAIAIKPTGAAYTNIGTVYYYQRRYQDAAAAMEKATELTPEDAMFWGNLGDARRAEGQEAKASEAFRRAITVAGRQLAVNPKEALLLANAGTWSAKLSEKKQALGYISDALRLAPSDANVLFRAALVYELTGSRDRALKKLNEALQHGYSVDEIQKAPNLAALRNDPRYEAMLVRLSAK